MGYLTALLVSRTTYDVESEGKSVPVQALNSNGVVQICINLFLLLALDGGGRSASRPGRFTSGERVACNRRVGGCVGPRFGPETVGRRKICCLCWESNCTVRC